MISHYESIFKENTERKPCELEETSMENIGGVEARLIGGEMVVLWCFEEALK